MQFVIKNVIILTDILQAEFLDNAYIIVENGLITKISQGEIPLKYCDFPITDGHGNLLIPGLVNSHTHASMSLFRGLGEGYRDRLTKFMFPLEKKAVSKELVFLAALYGFAEMATHGITAFCDMYYYEDEVGKAAELLGMRGIIGQTIVKFTAPDCKYSYEGLELAAQSAKLWKNHPLIKFAYAPHAPYTVEPHILKKINELAEEDGSLVTMHVSEFEDEWDRIHEIADIKQNETVLAYLARQDLLKKHSIFAHLIHISQEDINILSQYNIHAAHCPVANAKSGKGISPVIDMYQKGITIGLGTDGPMSGNRLSLRDVLSYSYAMAKLRSGDPTHFSPNQILYLASKGGYDTLSISNGGVLKEGFLADFVLIDCQDIGMNPNYDPIANIVLAVSDRAFLGTWVQGVQIAEHGIPINCDWEIYKKEIKILINNLHKIIQTL